MEIRGETIAYAQFNVDTRTYRETPPRRSRFETKAGLWARLHASRRPPPSPLWGPSATPTPANHWPASPSRARRLPGSRVSLRPTSSARSPTPRADIAWSACPKASGPAGASRNEIAAVPNAEQPYFINRVDVPDTPGLAPVTLDINLKRGVWITGRVTDKVTGKPVPSSLQLFPVPDQSLRRESARVRSPDGFALATIDDCVTRPDGSFRLVGLPGTRASSRPDAPPWAARSTPHALSGSYRQGRRGFRDRGDEQERRFPDVWLAVPCQRETTTLSRKSIRRRRLNRSSVISLLDPGGTMQIHLVDGKGKPVDMCRVSEGTGMGSHDRSGGSRESTFDLTGLAPNESRSLLICKPKRNIGKVLTVRYDEKSPRSITVTLEPCATVKGRLVDEDGVPVKDLRSGPWRTRGRYVGLPARQFECDAEGRFVDAESGAGLRLLLAASYGTRR